MSKILVINAVGLRPCDLSDAPQISQLASTGFMTPLETVFPAVTSTVQATWLTGKLPAEHGIVANGWYFRDLAQVMLWRQANDLVQGEKFYETARRRDPAFTCAKMFWWFNMYADVAYAVTPRPEYYANGLKRPGVYSHPATLAADLQQRLGDFPLFNFWGPMADLRSTTWIVDATLEIMSQAQPTMTLAYLPHLDYDHQRYGPDHERSKQAVRDLDREVGRLWQGAREYGYQVVVLSEYGLTDVEAPVFINRHLHERGWLSVQETSHGQLLDAGASAAFAVADHQCAHVYVDDESDITKVRDSLAGLDGVSRVLDRNQQREWGIDHERSGELVCMSEPTTWFAYHYWLDETRRPDFATTVDIHRKPGYDPTELFMDPNLMFPKLRVAKNLAKKLLGFRYLMDVIGTDPSIVRGSHGLLPADSDRGPLFISTFGEPVAEKMPSTKVGEFLLGGVQ